MMEQQLHAHIMHRAEEIQGLVNKTIQEYVTDGTLERIVDAEVRRILDSAVKDSIDRYFRLGNGRNHIDKKVEAVLREVLK
jgi:hypothetical protein